MAATSWIYEDSEEEFEEESENAFVAKSALLVLIDCTPDMFQPWKEDGSSEDVPFKAAIKCCQAMWRSLVISNPNDKVSIVLVGTKQAKNSSNFENLYQLQELSTVKVAMIEELNAMLASDDFDEFEEKIGSSDSYDLKDVFWLSKIIFDEAAKLHKKIMYFTRRDNPHEAKKNLQKEAVIKFKDIGKVQFTVVAFSEDFQLKNFYSNIVEDESSLLKAENVQDLMKIVRVKRRMRRAVSKTTFELVPTVQMAVGVYTFVRQAKKPKSITINIKSNTEIQKTVNEFHSETGRTVLKSEERKMLEVQGERVIFTNEELKKTKLGFETGIKLIGFVDAGDFNHFSWYRRPGSFLYPDEERITGSKELFTALLKRCQALNKVALVRVLLSRGRTPKLACLIPSLGDQTFPQGFHVFPIPFSDEIRKYELDKEFNQTPSAELEALMEKVIKKTTNKGFDVLDVYNPSLQYLHRALEKYALGEDVAEDEFFDFTEPNEDLMEQRLGNLPNEIDQEVESCTSHYASQRSTAPVTKRQKQVDMAMEVRHKRVDKLTVAVLKEFLESQKVNTAKLMRKAQYVEAVYEHFDK